MVKKYRADIDGLRAISILAVLVYHAFPLLLPGGFIGVDVFFVISGFLITNILLSEFQENRFSVLEFYKRRIRRIFPALVVVLFFVLVLGKIVLRSQEIEALRGQIVAACLFASNFLFWKEAGYFDSASDLKPLLHLWSLGVEEQFYFVWPLLILVSLKYRKYFLLLGTVIVSLILSAAFTHSHSSAAFYLLPFRFWEMGIGGLLAGIHLFPKLKGLSDKALKFPNLLSGLGLIGLCVGLMLCRKGSVFPGVIALVPVLASVFIIMAERSYVNRVILSASPLVVLGLISYPLYLWHWPLLALGRTVVGKEIGPGYRFVLCLLSVVLAYLTYKLIELPLRRYRDGKTALAVQTGAFVLAGVAAFAFLKEDKSTAHMFADLNPSITYAEFSCPGELKEAGLNYCRKKGRAETILIGDSHAEHYFYGLDSVAKNGVMLAGNSSCPAVLGISVEGDQPKCREKYEVISHYIGTNPDIKRVVISNFSGHFQDKNFAADHILNHTGPAEMKINGYTDLENKYTAYVLGLKQMIHRTLSQGKQVFLFADIPELDFIPADCIPGSQARVFMKELLGVPKFANKNCAIPSDLVKQRLARYNQMLSDIRASYPEVVIVNPTEYMCSDKSCMAMNEAGLLYRDSHHLSLTGSKWLLRKVVEDKKFDF
ncbi:acyltransferase family protein [Bdellovibrio sp. HCB209]|uniref:acyltransferase family protein n=1 Tax=Bdellovibrio sp. HCB209 TaxID=3394354 RepID=UPI0039B4FB67